MQSYWYSVGTGDRLERTINEKPVPCVKTNSSASVPARVREQTFCSFKRRTSLSGERSLKASNKINSQSCSKSFALDPAHHLSNGERFAESKCNARLPGAFHMRPKCCL